eukprot:TRINITY_DN5372_c0_g1_i2.p1 TRINITY_DN5372_c0_g1~~TRINITY_DN5372_c0_g1_i2.p1  ORF type:complete len:162 (+),score=25.51 TRINITY_DN5372_c0_g1_i2:364-849(+)
MARNHISLITHKNARFLITDRPTEDSIADYLEILKQHNVKALVRVCEPSYSTDQLMAAGIAVHDWGFQDGAPPPDQIINNWNKLCSETFTAGKTDTIAVHCVAGLGRAPVLVALSLIENGMSSEDAVIFIREKRHGAINRKQLVFLQSYRRRSGGKACIIM